MGGTKLRSFVKHSLSPTVLAALNLFAFTFVFVFVFVFAFGFIPVLVLLLLAWQASALE